MFNQIRTGSSLPDQPQRKYKQGNSVLLFLIIYFILRKWITRSDNIVYRSIYGFLYSIYIQWRLKILGFLSTFIICLWVG